MGYDEDDEDEYGSMIPPMGFPPIPDQEKVPGADVSRSRADDILDAVEGVSRHIGVKMCPVCPESILVVRGSGLGGAKSLFCRSCRLEIPWASTGSPVVAPSTIHPMEGPFYGPPKGPPSKNLPAHRMAMEQKKK